MATHTRVVDLYNAQVGRFQRLNMDARQGHQDLAAQALKDSLELTGGTPTGKARKRLLRELGHPFGRVGLASAIAKGNASPGADLKAVGRWAKARRGSTAAQRRKAGIKGQLPSLPIGMMSGKLRRSFRMNAGTAPPGGQAYDVGAYGVPYAEYVLGHHGTRKMVARGYSREIRKRWRPRNKAYYETFVRKQRTS